MRVLVACEFSGVVREAFRKRGHDAFSCDFLPSPDDSPYHYQLDVRRVLDSGWDLMIAHPPCTALTVSGNHVYAKGKPKADEREKAMELVIDLLYAPIDKVCIENPVGVISSLLRKPDQTVQPYEFGDDASKRTCLWLRGLSPLPIIPSRRVPGRLVAWNGKMVERWSNQTDSGQNKLGPSPDRAMLRSITYQGIADAMAETWG